MTNPLGNEDDSANVDKWLLAEYKVISSSLERLEKGFESVEQNIALLQQKLPQTIREFWSWVATLLWKLPYQIG